MKDILGSFKFMVPSSIEFGIGLLDQVGESMDKMGARKILFVTDPYICKTVNFERAIQSLEKKNLPYEVFADVESDPSPETCQNGVKKLKSKACDWVLALGGGSVIDAAKAIGWMSTNPGSVRDYEGADKLKVQPIPVAAIPTAAGTGSEVTGSSVLKDRQGKYKVSVRSSMSIPKIVILDPTVLTTLPRHIAAWTGMDALTHAIEAYTSTFSSLISDALAIMAIEIIGSNLRPFVARRDNLTKNSHMLIASTMAGIAFGCARVATVHALSHPVGARHGVQHGLANAILLPHVMHFNLSGNFPKYARIAQALGENIQAKTQRDAAQSAIEAIISLSDDLDIPPSLKDVNVTEDSISEMVADAIRSGIHIPNPKETNEEDMKALYQRALQGRDLYRKPR